MRRDGRSFGALVEVESFGLVHEDISVPHIDDCGHSGNSTIGNFTKSARSPFLKCKPVAFIRAKCTISR